MTKMRRILLNIVRKLYCFFVLFPYSPKILKGGGLRFTAPEAPPDYAHG